HAFSDDLEIAGADHAEVAALHQQAAVDAFEIPRRRGCRQYPAHQQAHVFLFRNDFADTIRHARRDDHFDELTVDDGFRGRRIEFTVEGDNAAEGGFGVRRKGQIVSFANGFGDCDTAWVCVFDDDAGRLVELFYAFECGVGIGDVVVRQLLALQLLRGTDAGFVQIFFRVERGKLVRVFAVAHFLFFVQL